MAAITADMVGRAERVKALRRPLVLRTGGLAPLTALLAIAAALVPDELVRVAAGAAALFVSYLVGFHDGRLRAAIEALRERG